MAIKKDILNDLDIQMIPPFKSPGLDGIAGLFNAEEVLSDDKSITILKPLRILGLHRRVSFIEKQAQKEFAFTDAFKVTVPAGTVHIVSSIEDFIITYGELDITLLGNSGFILRQRKARRGQISMLGVNISVDNIGDLEAGGGQPPVLVRKAEIRVDLIVHSAKSLPSFGAVCKFNLLFLGSE